jgi:hypothetical protein
MRERHIPDTSKERAAGRARAWPLLLCCALLPPVESGAQARKLRPFTVSGTVVDASGKPLEGVTVSLEADFIYGRAQVTTGADGRYLITDLIKATYRAQAWIQAPYAGGVVCHRLAMPKGTDYNSFPVSEGAERNFRWQMTGRIGFSESFHGASIRIWNADSLPLDAGGAVEFTLTPTAPLLDGTRGAVIVKQAPLNMRSSERGLDDLPLSTYRLKAVLVARDGRKTPLSVKPIGAERYAAEIDVVWTTESRCGFGTDNGVSPFYVEFLPPRT